MKGWLAALIGGCGLVAAGFLPPRGTPDESALEMWTPWYWARTPERRRVAQLASQWHAAQRALLTAEYSDSVGRWLAGRPDTARRPLLLSVTPLPERDRAALAAALDSAVARLGMTPEVVLGVVVVPETIALGPGRPRARWIRSPMYLTPRETQRSACIMVLPLSPRRSRFRQLLSAFGPCTYYAAFGQPGSAIARWLHDRHFDLAYVVDWASDFPTLSRSVYRELAASPPGTLRRHYAGSRFEAIACAGGRADACRTEVLRTLAPAPGHADFVTTDYYWWRAGTLEGALWFFSDLIRERGRDRFGRFWRSEQPVDSAFADAFGEPMGAWTARWQRNFLPRLPLGPGVGIPTASLALLLGGLSITLTLLFVGRRQVV